MHCTQEELEDFLKEAWSYESREGWNTEELETEFIGTLQKGNIFYDLYVDTEENFWYTVRVLTERGIVSEYEAIFGHPDNRRVKRQGTKKRRR